VAQHHIVVLVPKNEGGWRAHFPDLETSIDNAAGAAAEMTSGLRRQGAPLPSPRSYEEVRADDGWASERGIDWSTAVISLVRV
jgi:hypothetical protein